MCFTCKLLLRSIARTYLSLQTFGRTFEVGTPPIPLASSPNHHQPIHKLQACKESFFYQLWFYFHLHAEAAWQENIYNFISYITCYYASYS